MCVHAFGFLGRGEGGCYLPRVKLMRMVCWQTARGLLRALQQPADCPATLGSPTSHTFETYLLPLPLTLPLCLTLPLTLTLSQV